LAGVEWTNERVEIGKVTICGVHTKYRILWGNRKRSDPCLFNGDNICLIGRPTLMPTFKYDRILCWLFSQDHFRNFYLGIDRLDIYKYE
jgi:hypothetical protein